MTARPVINISHPINSRARDFFTPDNIQQDVERHGFMFFELGDHNTNLVAYRTPNRAAGYFDDVLTWTVRIGGRWHLWAWKVTTDPGLAWLQDPNSRPDGTAILAHPQQLRGSHIIRPHGGAYDAICQRHGTVVPVWRDADKDAELDLGGQIHNNGRGINIHRAHSRVELEQVGRYSAGCIVHALPASFVQMMELARQSAALWGNSFSVTILPLPFMPWSTLTPTPLLEAA